VPRFLPETSVMVAAVCTWHEHHWPAVAEIERRLEQGEELVAAGPALVEAYAVLTRLPPPYRVAPTDAHALLEANFLGGEVAALDGAGFREVLARAPAVGTAGGQVYDAVIDACARAAGVETLLTFNARHFQRLAGRGLAVVVPSGAGEH
jgi:predicted nucleic acid-binding protein